MNTDLHNNLMSAESLFSRKKQLLYLVCNCDALIKSNLTKRRPIPARMFFSSKIETADADSQPSKQAYLGQP